MNILFICDEYPPGLNGGIGTVTQSLSREMVAQGHNVFVVGLYTYEYGGADYEEDLGVKVWRLRYGFKLPNFKTLYAAQRKIPNSLKRMLFGKRDFGKFVSFVSNLIETHKIDIIEQPDWNTFAYNIGLHLPIFPKLSIPVVLKSNGSHSYFCKELDLVKKPHFAAVDVAIFNRADALAAVSKHTAMVNKEVFVIERPIEILYNSIEIIERQVQEREENLVVFTGTLVKKKGIFQLMGAWNLVIKKHPNARLVVLGKGDTTVLQNLITPAYRQSVSFEGHVTKDTVMDYLSKASLAVFPSYSEAFSLAILESMSVACPTIYSTRSSGREVINDGENGLLIDPDNIEEIADKIVYLLENKEKRGEMALAGKYTIVRNFGIKKSVMDHIEFYKKVQKDFL